MVKNFAEVAVSVKGVSMKIKAKKLFSGMENFKENNIQMVRLRTVYRLVRPIQCTLLEERVYPVPSYMFNRKDKLSYRVLTNEELEELEECLMNL